MPLVKCTVNIAVLKYGLVMNYWSETSFEDAIFVTCDRGDMNSRAL